MPGRRFRSTGRTSAQQEDDAGCQAEHGQPSRRESEAGGDGGRGDGEDGGHPHRIDGEQCETHAATERPNTGCRPFICREHQTAGDRAGGEQHGDEQQSAAQEHRREQPILTLADPVTNHADEPEERNTGERQQVQGENHSIAFALAGEPRTGVLGITRDSETNEHHRSREQQREGDARNRRRARGPHRLSCERVSAHLDRTVSHEMLYWRAMAIRKRSSGSMKWSLSSTPTSSCTQWILPVKRLVWAV